MTFFRPDRGSGNFFLAAPVTPVGIRVGADTESKIDMTKLTTTALAAAILGSLSFASGATLAATPNPSAAITSASTKPTWTMSMMERRMMQRRMMERRMMREKMMRRRMMRRNMM